MATEQEINKFAQSEQDKVNPPANAVIPNKELSPNDFSAKAIGDKVKYVRPDLNNKEDAIETFTIFMPDVSSVPRVSQDGKIKYWTVTILLTYASTNEDGMQNREYLSGAKMFQQNDGSPSEIQFWYNRADNQIANLWELVASTKKIKPEELSPRDFVSFLNSKPKVKIEAKKYKNYGASSDAPAFIHKNMIGKFL